MEEVARPSLASTISADSRTSPSFLFRRRSTKFFLAFLACTSYLALCTVEKASPWLDNLSSSAAPYGSQISFLFSHIFPDSSSSGAASSQDNWPAAAAGGLRTGGLPVVDPTSERAEPPDSLENDEGQESGVSVKNEPKNAEEGDGGCDEKGASTEEEAEEVLRPRKDGVLESKKQEGSGNGLKGDGNSTKNCKATDDQAKCSDNGGDPSMPDRTEDDGAANWNCLTANAKNKNGGEEKIRDEEVSGSAGDGREKVDPIAAMEGCNIFHGRWVKDDSLPLYPEGSCPYIDEPFDCYGNGRPDRAYQKLRWLPDGCDIPRLNSTDMLERLRGKRVAFVGDSLNRNMWESLVCTLRNVLEDKRNLFEIMHRNEFRSEGSYAFLFKDFNCSVEFFRSPFLVQEWEAPRTDGTTRETLRLDMVERSSTLYKDADVIVYNTGHWWTHEKTFKGKDYYQEGSFIYSELNVEEAFRRAITTWARWVDANVNPSKTLVFFRGYSASHFSGGQWNSGGQCDDERTPIEDERFLSPYPTMMSTLESVISRMKNPVSYMNITRMTDYRKDGHPSVYTAANLSNAERRSPAKFQDCSHWCLPGVPDSWNELLYALLLKRQHQMQ